ncbi:MAG: hypothetical protein GY847_40720 [Proteobacteria bacterium]|nr:hypothetical protein [Pseudomonadota bacterium]
MRWVIAWQLVLPIAVQLGCADLPDKLLGLDGSIDEGIMADSDSDTKVDVDNDEDPENDTESGTGIDADSDDNRDTTDSDDDRDTTSDDDRDTTDSDDDRDTTDSDDDRDTTSDDTSGDSDLCPWECVALNGPGTCSMLSENWVHNTKYQCINSDSICCQPLGTPDGLEEDCARQPALKCAASCEGRFFENPDYYCNDATNVCCEDPNGPTYTCKQAGGKCVGSLSTCPNGLVRVGNRCAQFLKKCCLEPVCPWECVLYDGPETCSESLNPPEAVRNHAYSCENPESICCQPLTPDGNEEQCPNQMACRKSCIGQEKPQTEYYCDSADRVCCHDARPLCSEIGGTCERSILGTCSNGKQKNNRGICKGNMVNCCTDIAQNNICAKRRGKCVNLGQMCPLLYLPDPLTSCGDLLKMCCSPIL